MPGQITDKFIEIFKRHSNIKEHMKKVSSKLEVPDILHVKYIEDGYRINHSIQDAIHSLFYFHNETMNIWTHFVGFICIIIVGIDFAMDYLALQHLTNAEFIAFEIYIICTASCLLFSTLYHLFRCISETVHINLLRLDLTGVGFQAAGSFIPLAFFGFHCVPDSRNFHLGLSGLVLVVGIITPWIEYKVYGYYIRPYILAALFLFSLIPITHWFDVTPDVYKVELFWGFILYFFWNILGFTLFIIRYPEIQFPKSFLATQVLSSHTLWHLSNLAGIYIWYHHIMKYQSLLKSIGCSAYE